MRFAELAEGGQATFSAAHEDRMLDSTLCSKERKPYRVWFSSQSSGLFPASRGKLFIADKDHCCDDYLQLA
jgi:hypothetical protein